MKNQTKTREELLKNIHRIVVKVGTSTLTTEDGNLNIDKIKKIAFVINIKMYISNGIFFVKSVK